MKVEGSIGLVVSLPAIFDLTNGSFDASGESCLDRVQITLSSQTLMVRPSVEHW